MMDPTAASSLNLTISNSDWITKTLGDLLDQNGLIAAGLYYYNQVMLAVLGALLFWLLTRGIVATAQHGKIAGKHNEVWFPIRFILAIGIITPLPPAGLNGGQLAVVGVAEFASAAGSQLWAKVGDGINQMKPLVAPVPPSVQQLAHAVWLMDVCTAMQNRIAATSNGPTITINTKSYDDRSVLSADGLHSADCGAIIVPAYANQLAKPIQDAETRATMTLLQSLQPAAATLAEILLPPFDSATAKPASPNVDIAGLVRQFSDEIKTATDSVVQMNNNDAQARQALSDAMTSGGWEMAGAWTLRIASTNAELTSAMDSIPTGQPPHLEYFANDVHAQFRAALTGADEWWMKRAGQSDPQIEEAAYNAGTEDSWWASIDFSRWKGLYDSISVDSDTAVNPIAEIVKLGHGLLHLVGTAVGTFLTMAIGGKVAEGVLALIPVVGGGLSQIAGAITDGVSATAGSASETAPMFWLVMMVLFTCGLSLAFFIPMQPFLYWLLLVARFLMKTFIGILAAPLWAIAHLELDGEGIGDRAKSGYMHLLSIFITPMVSVLALLIGLGIFIAMAHLFAMGFYPALRNTLQGHFGGFSALFAFTVLSVAALIMVMHFSMKIVVIAPDEVMEIICGLVGKAMSGADHESAVGTAAGTAAAGGAAVTNAVNAQARRSGGGGKGGKGGGEEGTWRPTGGRMDDSVPRAEGPAFDIDREG